MLRCSQLLYRDWDWRDDTMQEWTAEKLGVGPDLVGVASTGVISELLPMDTLKNSLSSWWLMGIL